MNDAGGKSKTSPLVWVVIVLGGGFLLLGCCGILAAIAIPSFIDYLVRAKTAEAEMQLDHLFVAAAAHYAEESFAGGEMQTGCVVDSAITPNAPSSHKTVLDQLPQSFETLGWHPADPLYYQYEIVSVGGCGHEPRTEVYRFLAHGDLDGDGVQSTFELVARVTPEGTLERAGPIRRENERE